jgi:hypothetical protein
LIASVRYGFFIWDNIPGWRWRMKTSKSKYRPAADFDLTKYDLLLQLPDTVPHENRTDAIVKGEKNLPVRRAMDARWRRQIARAEGSPGATRARQGPMEATGPEAVAGSGMSPPRQRPFWTPPASERSAVGLIA